MPTPADRLAKLRDPAIRAVLLPTIRASLPTALLVQEWGIGYQFVADVAAIGEVLTEAWEIKSEADSLARLKRQVPLYGAAFDHCSLVAAPRHVERALALLPDWWGVMEYDRGALSVRRAPQPNSAARPEGLLWVPEIVALMKHFDLWATALRLQREFYARLSAEHGFNYGRGSRRPGKRHMLEALATVPRAELAPLVCAALRARTDWRRPDGYRRERAG